MKIIKSAKEGLFNLFTSKLRSILALLGILVGTASVVAMVSGGELATNEALKQFKVLGTDLLAISITDASPLEGREANLQAHLSLDEAISLKNLDPHIEDVAPYTQLYQPVQFDGQELNGNVLGVTNSFGRIVHVEMNEGRFISTLDQYAMFAVVGADLNQKIKEISHQNAIGQQIQVGKNFFTIVGVAKPWPENSFVYANINHAVLIPILTSSALSKYSSINNLILRLAPTAKRIPISRRLSTTETSIIFITPIPPTINEILPINPKKTVKI